MIVAGNLSIPQALGLLVVLTAAIFPVMYRALRRYDDGRFEDHVRARGARRASDRRLDQLGDLVDDDVELERYYGTVEPLDDRDHHRP